MNRIDRYIASVFFGYFLGGMIVFVTIFVAVDMLSFASRHADVGVEVLTRYYLYFLPAVVYQMVPVGCLLGTVFTLTALNRSQELVALYSVGMGLVRVAAPLLTSVAIVSAMTFIVGDQVLPRSARQKNYVQFVEIEKRPGLYSTVNTNRIWYRSENVLFNLQTLNVDRSSAQGLTMYYFDSAWNLVQVVGAEKVKFHGVDWTLSKGTVTVFDDKSSFPLSQQFKEKHILMSGDFSDMQKSSDSSEVMSLRELNKFISRNREAGLDTLRYEVDFHAKFGFAGAALVMSLLGIPFSVRRARSGGTALSVGICLLLAFVYWLLFSSSVTLGQHGYLAPLVSAWAPNLIMAGIAGWLIARLRQ